MTPFEKAKKNVQELAIKLNLQALILQTIEETKDLPPDEADQIWKVIFMMLDSSDISSEDN